MTHDIVSRYIKPRVEEPTVCIGFTFSEPTRGFQYIWHSTWIRNLYRTIVLIHDQDIIACKVKYRILCQIGRKARIYFVHILMCNCVYSIIDLSHLCIGFHQTLATLQSCPCH